MMPFKNDLHAPLSRPGLVCAGIAALSAGALGAALAAQYGWGLAPCILCLYQRVPYGLAIIAGLTGLGLSRKNRTAAAWMILISGLFFLAGAMIAAYHSGVEQHWWPSFLTGCQAEFSPAAGDLLSQIEGAQAVRCDVIPWADPVLGLSMAAWNTLTSAALSMLCLISGRRILLETQKIQNG